MFRDQETAEHKDWADVLNLRLCFVIALLVLVGLESHCMPLPAWLVLVWMLPERRTEAEPICLHCPTTTGFLPQPRV